MPDEGARYGDPAVSGSNSLRDATGVTARSLTAGTDPQSRTLPQDLGHEQHAVSREVRKGFVAGTYDLLYRQETIQRVEAEPSLVFGVCTGKSTSLLSINNTLEIEIKPLCPILIAICDHATCIGRHQAGSHYISVGFHVTKTYLETLVEELGCQPFLHLLRLLHGEMSFHYPPPSGRLFATATDMLDNPYDGALLHLHIESCALSLLTELARIVSDQADAALTGGLGRGGLNHGGLNRRELDRAHEVRCILEDNTVNPPSLAELSRLVGVNPTTLSQQFKAVFGSTIFAYLRSRRLELAHEILRSQAIPVSQVGYRVGFNNPGAFATAYRRHFGRPPSAEPRDVVSLSD